MIEVQGLSGQKVAVLGLGAVGSVRGTRVARQVVRSRSAGMTMTLRVLWLRMKALCVKASRNRGRLMTLPV